MSFPSQTLPPKVVGTFIFAYMRAIYPFHLLLNFVTILINRQKHIQLVLSPINRFLHINANASQIVLNIFLAEYFPQSNTRKTDLV